MSNENLREGTFLKYNIFTELVVIPGYKMLVDFCKLL